MKHTGLAHRCPFCAAVHTVATDVLADRQPRIGDVGLCIECGEPFFYTLDGKGQRPTVEQRATIVNDSRYIVLLAGLAIVQTEMES